jgi:hypothetical protein
MRSPWKVIAGLVSRGKSEISDESARASSSSHGQPGSGSTSDPSTPLPAEAELEQTTLVSEEVASLRETPLAESPHDPAPSVEQSAPPEVIPGNNQMDSPVDGSEGSSAGRSDSAPVLKRHKVESKKPSMPVIKNGKRNPKAASPKFEADQTSEPPRQRFADDAIGLDKEINDLRHQLAEKLRVQNAHLRQLLERYDL